MVSSTSDETAGRDGGLYSRAFLALCLVYFLNSFISSPFSSLFPVYIEADLQRPPWFTGYLRALMLLIGGISLLLFAMGAANGPWSTAGQSILINAITPARLGLGGGIYFLSNTIGNSLGSLCTGLVKTDYSFAQIGTAMSVGMLAVIVVAFVSLPGDAPAAHSVPTTRLSTWAAYRPLLGRRDVHLLLSLRLTITTFWGMATLALPLLIYRVSQDESQPAYFAAISLVVAACCQLSVGYLNDRLGRAKPLIVSAMGICLSALGLALFHDSVVSLFFFGTALTGTAWAVSTLIPRLINDVAGPEEKNRLVGLGHLAWSSSMVTGSLVGGYLIDLDAALPFYIGAALAGLGSLVAISLCRSLDNAGK